MKTLHTVHEIDIDYVPAFQVSEQPKIMCSEDTYKLLIDNWRQLYYRETFKVIYLNRNSHVLGIKTVSTGGLSGTVADPKHIFQGALKANASHIILAHNHPSSNNRPSQTDIMLTNKLKAAGEALELPVTDHIILVPEGEYFSFADEGLI